MVKLCVYIISFFVLCLATEARATPLFSMQAAESCDTCHEMPDRSDPRWLEENYSVSERQCRLSCGVCHVNPSGGMLRNRNGFIFGTKELPMEKISPEDFKSAAQILRPNGFLSFGGDFRGLILSREGSDADPLFFPMQADLYVNANVGKHIAVLAQIGMERGGNSAVREEFVMLKDFPYNSYIKAGKFIPPYGLRLEDHTAFIRDKIGLNHSKPEAYVSGYEAGAEPVLLFARFSQFNADVTPAGNADRTPRGVSGEAGWRGLWLHLGLSYLDIKDFETTAVTTTDRTSYGAFGAVRLKWIPYIDRLTYLFERDFRREHIEGAGVSEDEDARITFNELDYKVAKGANIKLRYETYEPEESSTDNIERKRYVGGIDLYPYPFTELNIQYRLNKEEGNDDVDEFLVLAHIWF